MGEAALVEASAPHKPRGRPRTAKKPNCEFRDPDGVACLSEAAFIKPGRIYCRTHYDKLRRDGKLAPLFTPTDKIAFKVKTASDFLHTAAPAYAELHFLGAMNAAQEGNTKPCEWLLEHTRVVQPIEKGDSGPRISVQVGIALPGLGMSAQASESKALPAITVTMGEAQPQLEAESASVNTPKS